jgi:tetratricopeptide (TPR) repeat protein
MSPDPFGDQTVALPDLQALPPMPIRSPRPSTAPAASTPAVLPPRTLRAPRELLQDDAPEHPPEHPPENRREPPRENLPPNSAATRAEPARVRALRLYELALADLRVGKTVSAHLHAKLALQACPGEPKVKALLDHWDIATQQAKAVADDQRLVAEAQKAEDAGEFGRALHLLKQAAERNPGAAGLHNRIGVILATRICDYAAASNALLRAVELDPHNMIYRSNLGKVFRLSEGKKSGELLVDGRPSVLDRLKDKLR